MAGLLAGKAATSHTHDDRYYTEAEVDALIAAVETGEGWAPVSASTTVQGIVELATTTEASTGTDTTRAVTPAGVAAAIAGVGGGVRAATFGSSRFRNPFIVVI